MIKRILYIAVAILATFTSAFAISPQERTAVESDLIDILVEDSIVGSAKILDRLKALSLRDPQNDAIHYNLSLKYYAVNRIKESVKEAQIACSLDPKNDKYKELLANLYSIAGLSAKAAEIYLALLEESPQKYSNAYTLTLLAEQRADQGQDSLAIDAYDQALMYEPDYAPAIVGKAEIYRIRRNYASFFATMKPLINSTNIEAEPKAQYVKSILEHIDSRVYQVWHQQLDDMVEDCYLTHPKDSSAIKLAAEWFYSTGQKDKGEEYFRKLVNIYPDDVEAHYYILQIKAEKHDLSGMIHEAKNIVALSKNKDEIISALSTLGDCYYEYGEVKLAYKSYKQVLKLNPNYAPVLNNYAYFLCLEGRQLAKAEKMSKITIDQEPDNPTYLDTYGWILHLRGKDAEAQPYFKHAMLYGGKENKDVLQHYIVVLENLGETGLAAYYKNLVDTKQ